MRILTVRHATTYRYARPVKFGQHRLMLRPRDSHDLRLVAAELTLSPPGNLRWMHDVFGNSVALVDFNDSAAMLSITSTLRIERYGAEGLQFPIAPEAEFYPFIYSSSDRVDLSRLLEQHYPDPNGILARWADSFVTSRPMRTLELLTNMNAALKPDIIYAERHEAGTQSPAQTLETKTGACRDLAISDSAHASSAVISTIRRSIAVMRRKPLQRPMRGPRSICRAPAGSSTTQPTCSSLERI
jgi:transglutaminase-like putative cysteine protease